MGEKADIILGADLGGTSLRVLAADRKYRILSVEKNPTMPDASAASLIKDIAAAARRAAASAKVPWHSVRALSVGAPGAVDPERGIVYMAPNLGWENIPLARRLGALLSIPVFVENDVNAGTIGEYVLGAGRGTRNMIGIFVGTGIGVFESTDGGSSWQRRTSGVCRCGPAVVTRNLIDEVCGVCST